MGVGLGSENPARPGRISVVMPCFNAEAFVGEAIDSVLAQTHPDVEIIVVDDGSSDRSPEIVRSFGPQVQVLEQRNRGPYPARNAGLRVATGEFVAFLDADDYWHKDCLERLHRALEGGRGDIAYCGWQNVGERSGREFVPPIYEDGDPVAAFLTNCPWPIHAALTRRRVLSEAGGFSERRFSAMDYDLWLRLLTVTRRLVHVPEVLAFYRWHGAGQISATKWRQTLDAWEVRRGFVDANRGLVAHIDRATLRQLIDSPLLKAAYEAYWRRDLVSAHRLFRASLRHGVGHARDLRHLLLSLLPRPVYCTLIAATDRSAEKAPLS
jgi:glycosyltransferase involved in cell wall biosynthesis